MKVYKFGGASVRSAEGVNNLYEIIKGELDKGERLFVVISAMGKTTNALEKVTEHFMKANRALASEAFTESEEYHSRIIGDLFGEETPESVSRLFNEVHDIIATSVPQHKDYDMWYDRIVGYGELISTAIISEFLNSKGLRNKWIDMRHTFVTDPKHRDANIDIEVSAPLFISETSDTEISLFIGQGFIGGSPEGNPTTLGREGSDYSAAVAAHILDAESVTIWKDVEGILNADPKFFEETKFIPELTYLDAIELAYSGAQIIHPKTIKPLQNKDIPLYVRPFNDYAKPGSIIKGEMKGRIEIPILILKHNQVLISIRPHDFSFVLEDRFGRIFSLLEAHNVKINLIQSSAVNLSICVDNSRRLPEVVDQLRDEEYRVVYNDNMELLTIRGYTRELFEKYGNAGNTYLSQKTRRTVRIVRKKAE